MFYSWIHAPFSPLFSSNSDVGLVAGWYLFSLAIVLPLRLLQPVAFGLSHLPAIPLFWAIWRLQLSVSSMATNPFCVALLFFAANGVAV